VKPQKPYLELPIVLLIDTSCFSSNEYFIAGMKDNKRAILLGETTGGGSGNPIKLIFPFKKSFFELFISTWLYFRPNGQPLEGRGIKPHIIIKPRIKDLLAQNDAVLRRARAEAKRLIKR
jgi:C-terminal processing protease CtpA/Prc